MEPSLHNIVDSIQGPRTAQMHEAALSREIGELVDVHAADIAASQGLEFSASPTQEAGRSL